MSYNSYPYFYGPYPASPRHLPFYHRNFRQPNYYRQPAFYQFGNRHRQLDPAFQKVWGVMQKDLESVYEQLMEYSMNRATARFFVQQMVIFAMQHAPQVFGSSNQRVNQLWTLFAQGNVWLMGLLSAYRIPRQQIESMVRRVFALTLENLDYSPEMDSGGWGN